jgi:hypothetical protein
VPNILKIDDENKKISSWRFEVISAALAKIGAGMPNHPGGNR